MNKFFDKIKYHFIKNNVKSINLNEYEKKLLENYNITGKAHWNVSYAKIFKNKYLIIKITSSEENCTCGYSNNYRWYFVKRKGELMFLTDVQMHSIIEHNTITDQLINFFGLKDNLDYSTELIKMKKWYWKNGILSRRSHDNKTYKLTDFTTLKLDFEKLIFGENEIYHKDGLAYIVVNNSRQIPRIIDDTILEIEDDLIGVFEMISGEWLELSEKELTIEW